MGSTSPWRLARLGKQTAPAHTNTTTSATRLLGLTCAQLGPTRWIVQVHGLQDLAMGMAMEAALDLVAFRLGTAVQAMETDHTKGTAIQAMATDHTKAALG